MRRYDIQLRTESSGGETLQLNIRGALASDSGDYECRASNEHGTNSVLHKLQVQGESRPIGIQVWLSIHCWGSTVSRFCQK